MPEQQQLGFLATLAAHPALFVSICVLFGLLIGSFLNVVIYRVPIMMDNELRAECAALAEAEAPPPEVPSAVQLEVPLEVPPEAAAPEPEPAGPAPFNLIVPRSACPACKTPIRPQENIPVVSWFMLGGKCSACGAPISLRYPMVELSTGILSGWVAWHFGFGTTALAALAFTWFLIALTMIDFDTQFLPDQLTYPLLWLGLLLSLLNPVWAPGAEPLTPRDSIIGAAVGYLSLWGVYWLFKFLIGKEGMGYGDFKLFAALGAWLGWQMLLPVLIFASGVGALYGVYLMIRHDKGRDSEIAFGPFLSVAGWLALMFGHQSVALYYAKFDVLG